MIARLTRRFHDMKTLKTLLQGAEHIAHQSGDDKPGAEHLVLSALALEDGTARDALARLGTDGDAFSAAVARQYEEALQGIGLNVTGHGSASMSAIPVEREPLVYQSQASTQTLMQTLAREIMPAQQRTDSAMPLLGAHVLLAVSDARYGVVARAFRLLDIDGDRLREAAAAAISDYRQAAS